MSKIPLSKDFSITPNTISPAGTALEANGLILSDNDLFPVGEITEFVGGKDVGDFVGYETPEYRMSQTYFKGYTGSSVKPAKLLFGRLVAEDAPAIVLGASLKSTKLSDLVGLKGTLAVDINGKAVTSSSIDLTNAGSFSDVASMITTSFSPEINITKVDFDPASLKVPVGMSSGQSSYTISPDNANENVIFSVPDDNNNDINVDATNKKVTLTRNDSAPKYSVTAKGDRTSTTVGKLAVEFDVAVNLTGVTFTPTSLTVESGVNTGNVTYNFAPSNATENIVFEVPAANKDDIAIDKVNKKITFTRNDNALSYTLNAKGETTGDTLGTLKVEFKPTAISVTKVEFYPTSLSVDNGNNTATSQYTITPNNANEAIDFTVPEANKNDIKVDETTKTITLTRNANALKYTVKAIGHDSGKDVGELPVEFKTASTKKTDDTEEENKQSKYTVIATDYNTAAGATADNYVTAAVIETNQPSSSNRQYTIMVPAANDDKAQVKCEWVASAQRFRLITVATGDNTEISYATSTGDDNLAEKLGLSQTSGARLSQGASAQTPQQVMNDIVDKNQNFILFASSAQLDDESKDSLCQFASVSNSRYGYVYTDDSKAALIANNTACFHQQTVIANNYESVFAMYGDVEFAAISLAYCASLNFNATNGRISFKFRQFSGISPNVSSLSDANALESNGYNYLGAYGLNNTLADYTSDGNITGQYKWLDSFIDEVFINANLVTGFANLFMANQSYPFNPQGYAAVESVPANVAARAINYGAIQRNVTLDLEQLAIVTGQTGKDLSAVLFSQGWYFYIPPQSGENRITRALKGAIFYWVDGQLIQSIQMASTTIL